MFSEIAHPETLLRCHPSVPEHFFTVTAVITVRLAYIVGILL
jgi:hypothetical protein